MGPNYNCMTKLENFITTPRFIASDYKHGVISRNELILFQWLRLNANPYGIATASISAIKQDMFPTTTENYVNKLLLSLRSKKYLYFQTHQGRRGSFEVRFGDWMLPNKQVVNLDKRFEELQKAPRVNSMSNQESEVSNNSSPTSQKPDSSKNSIMNEHLEESNSQMVRSPHNDNEHEHIKIDKKPFKGTFTENFLPHSHEESRILEIGQELGEQNIDFLRSILQKNSLGLIERAYGICREQIKKEKPIHSIGAYFNKVIQNLIDTDNAKK